MRIDGFARVNVGVGIGECVKVSKADVKIAEQVDIISPEGISTESDDTVKLSIISRPIVKGDIVPVWKTIEHPQFGKLAKGPMFSMIAIKTKPAGIVLIKENTEVINLDLL